MNTHFVNIFRRYFGGGLLEKDAVLSHMLRIKLILHISLYGHPYTPLTVGVCVCVADRTGGNFKLVMVMWHP